MRVLRKTLLVLLVAMVTSAPFHAQAPQPSTTATVPRVVPVAGIFVPADGQPPAPVETVTLSLYAEQTGGSPTWEEVQNVAVDASGRYSLLLGASLPEGLPIDVFASGEARWLGIRFARPGEGEAPRARLTSVPYALRAADAETLGGRPASAYLLVPPDGGGRNPVTPATGTTSTTVVAPSAINPGSTNAIAKYLNNGDTVGPSTLYESSENLGIGTGSSIAVSPSASVDRLNVRFTNTGGTLTGISLRNDGSTGSSYSGLLFYDQNGDLGQFQGFNNGTHEYRINNVARVSPGGAFNGSINFMIGGTSRFKVINNGWVGIGTNFPTGPLSVVRNGDFADAIFTTYKNDGQAAFLDAHRARGTEASPSPVQIGDVLLSLGGAGYNNIFFARAASIDAVAIGNFSLSENPAYIRFTTTSTGATIPSERVRITEAGNVGIGTPGPLDRLHVNGEVRVESCVKRSDATAIAGTCASDRRFKREITSFGAALQAVAALRPVHYYWRATEFPERHFGDGQSYGLIAQEAEEVLPDLVVTNPDGYKAVDYSKLPLLTVQAIKELKAENDELKTQSSAMQSRIAELERVVKQLLTDRSRF